MWPAGVTGPDPAPPLNLTVSLAKNGLQVTHIHTQIYRKTEGVRKGE